MGGRGKKHEAIRELSNAGRKRKRSRGGSFLIRGQERRGLKQIQWLEDERTSGSTASCCFLAGNKTNDLRGAPSDADALQPHLVNRDTTIRLADRRWPLEKIAPAALP